MRIDGLDLLRGVAVALVVLRHALPEVFPGAGVVGVVMFFALSGHLITGLLLEEAGRTGRVALGRFYRRRARRLVPALAVVVAVWLLVTLTLDPIGERDEVARTLLVAITWTGNLPGLVPGGATFHLWTLATEEQFYLLWPALLSLAVARGRVRLLLAVAAAACLLACVATTLWLAEDPDLAYPLPTSWALCFVIGAASRVLLERRPQGVAVPPVLVVLTVAALGVLAVVPLRGHALTYLAGGPAIAALTAVLLLAWRRWRTITGPLRALVWLGTVSYGAYLWSYPLTLWLRPHAELGGVVAAVLTVGAAALSWYAVERPLQRRRTTTVAVPA
ncbi:acyltransferase [Nocardioides sp. zg-DK7169]|uniref:acyltransferase family protein n=1 Tax=Nocardioides sp. zg-DK7169 TaxID=2736600 RepID=UPI0015563C03|nr:acyltransferase [Nocardioides sp. zg-DK7169]NPC97183.1 acyltransferase [Nocardioides sp. zg-DK7169]